ncbi:hypothetical protein MKZ38_002191 [Zalerion maritima]|uniref:Bromo domain-containing protein n=1 Tax=Zalerion maritima TaxID=339359 RepID=A0AAD5RP98_9PEZI|nr:hypothetical protein MKZ38_002191 [Zalerion maritima]
MNTSTLTAYTPLETLLLFQALYQLGITPANFVTISELIKNNQFVKDSESYNPGRLSPDALQNLFQRLLREELKTAGPGGESSSSGGNGRNGNGIHNMDSGNGNNGHTSVTTTTATDTATATVTATASSDAGLSPNSKKRKLPSSSPSPLPTLEEARRHADRLPTLVNQLYNRYRSHTIAEIQQHEQSYIREAKEHSEILQREWDLKFRREESRTPSRNGTPTSGVGTAPLPLTGHNPHGMGANVGAASAPSALALTRPGYLVSSGVGTQRQPTPSRPVATQASPAPVPAHMNQTKLQPMAAQGRAPVPMPASPASPVLDVPSRMAASPAVPSPQLPKRSPIPAPQPLAPGRRTPIPPPPVPTPSPITAVTTSSGYPPVLAASSPVISRPIASPAPAPTQPSTPSQPPNPMAQQQNQAMSASLAVVRQAPPPPPPQQHHAAQQRPSAPSPAPCPRPPGTPGTPGQQHVPALPPPQSQPTQTQTPAQPSVPAQQAGPRPPYQPPQQKTPGPYPQHPHHHPIQPVPVPGQGPQPPQRLIPQPHAPKQAPSHPSPVLQHPQQAASPYVQPTPLTPGAPQLPRQDVSKPKQGSQVQQLQAKTQLKWEPVVTPGGSHHRQPAHSSHGVHHPHPPQSPLSPYQHPGLMNPQAASQSPAQAAAPPNLQPPRPPPQTTTTAQPHSVLVAPSHPQPTSPIQPLQQPALAHAPGQPQRQVQHQPQQSQQSQPPSRPVVTPPVPPSQPRPQPTVQQPPKQGQPQHPYHPQYSQQGKQAQGQQGQQVQQGRPHLTHTQAQSTTRAGQFTPSPVAAAPSPVQPSVANVPHPVAHPPPPNPPVEPAQPPTPTLPEQKQHVPQAQRPEPQEPQQQQRHQRPMPQPQPQARLLQTQPPQQPRSQLPPPQGQQAPPTQQQTQRIPLSARPVASPAPTPAPTSSINSPLPRPGSAVPDHMRHASTPASARPKLPHSVPQTPASQSQTSFVPTSGSGTKWLTNATNNTPRSGAPDVAPKPAVAPLSPVQKPRQTPLSQVPDKAKRPASTLLKAPKDIKEEANKSPSQEKRASHRQEEAAEQRDGREVEETHSEPKKQPALEKLDTSRASRRPSRGATRNHPVLQAVTRTRRSKSVASTVEGASPTAPDMPPAKVKEEVSTPRIPDDTDDMTADEGQHQATPSRAPGQRPRLGKRKRQDNTPDVRTPSTVAPTVPPSHVLWTRGFPKVSASVLDQIASHRYANMFADKIKARDAPRYHDIVTHPQDLRKIRSAIHAGNKAATHALHALEGGDPGTPGVWVPWDEGLVPPKGIINTEQLECELVHMFSNAIMYNPDPFRGPGPGFRRPWQREEDERSGVLGYMNEPDVVVKDTRNMYVEVEKLLSELRSAEKDQPPLPPGAEGIFTDAHLNAARFIAEVNSRGASASRERTDVATEDDADELATDPDTVNREHRAKRRKA